MIPWRITACLLVIACGGCGGGDTGRDPTTAERAPVDRFSPAAATLLDRTQVTGLPDPGQPVDFDRDPFLIHGLGPSGQAVTWYLWDAQPTTPAPLYVLVQRGRMVEGQLPIFDVIPGDAGYNDLWREVDVEVPSDYVANSVTSFADLDARGFARTVTDNLVNCPLVPEGSTAALRLPGDYAEQRPAWYRDQIVFYFHFGEKPLAAVAGEVPLSAIYQADATDRSHDVVAHVPADAGYSPLRDRHLYDAAAIATVVDLTTAMAATPVASPALTVNTPVVEVGN